MSTHLGTQIGVRPKADKKAGGKGDEPDIDINDIKILDKQMKMNNSKIGTLAANIKSKEVYDDENIVKPKRGLAMFLMVSVKNQQKSVLSSHQ